MDSDELAEKVKAKLMSSIERMMREIIKQEVANLVSEAVRSELRCMTEGFNKIVEENQSLKIRVDNLEMQSRSNNLVIHGLPETSYAEAASTAEDVGGVVLRSPRKDTIRAVIDCCRSGMKLDITNNVIVNCYRISGSNTRPIVVTFSGKGVRDKVYAAKKALRGTRGSSQVFVNEHLTKRNTEIFAKGRKLLREKKIAAVWTWNGFVYLKRTESSRPVRTQDLEGLEKLI